MTFLYKDEIKSLMVENQDGRKDDCRQGRGIETGLRHITKTILGKGKGSTAIFFEFLESVHPQVPQKKVSFNCSWAKVFRVL